MPAKLATLLAEVFNDQAPLAAIGLPDAVFAGVTRFSTVSELPRGELFAGALWAGPVDEARAAALALRASVKEGGVILLLQVRGAGALATMRTWLTGGSSRSDEAVEQLCAALLCAGLARPSLVVDSGPVTAAMGRVRSHYPIP